MLTADQRRASSCNRARVDRAPGARRHASRDRDDGLAGRVRRVRDDQGARAAARLPRHAAESRRPRRRGQPVRGRFGQRGSALSAGHRRRAARSVAGDLGARAARRDRGPARRLHDRRPRSRGGTRRPIAGCCCPRSRRSGAGTPNSSCVRPASRRGFLPTPGGTAPGCSGSRRKCSATDAAARRAPLHRRRPASRRRPCGRDTLRGAADLHQVGGAMARPGAAAGRNRPLPAPRGGDRHRAGRGAQQLSDQHRRRGAAAARAVARGARRGIRPRRGAGPVRARHAPRLVHDRQRAGGAAADCAGPSHIAALAAPRCTADPPRAHRRAGHQPRPPLRTSRDDPRARSTGRRGLASASTPATCCRRDTISVPNRGIAGPSRRSIGSSASTASRSFT